MAELVQVPKWRAFDGREFPTQAEAETYEAENADLALVGLTPERLRAALAYEPGERALADAIERVAYKIALARKALGFLKRRPGAETPPSQPAAVPGDLPADPEQHQDEAA